MKPSVLILTTAIWLSLNVLTSLGQDEARPVSKYSRPVSINYDPDHLSLSPLLMGHYWSDLRERANARYGGESSSGNSGNDEGVLSFRIVLHSEQIAAGNQTGTLTITTLDTVDAPMRRELWDSLRRELESLLVKAQQASIELEERSRRQAMVRLSERRHRIAAELEQAIRDVTRASARRVPSVEFLSRRSNEMIQQQNELELDLEGIQARIDEIKKQIEIREQWINEEQESDDISKLLEDVVALRQQKLDHVRAVVEQSAGSIMQLRAAEEELLNARVDLLRARREAGKSTALQLRLQSLNDELQQLVIDSAEKSVHKRRLEERLAETMARIRQQSEVELESRRAYRRIEHLEVMLSRIEEKKDELRFGSEAVRPVSVRAWGQ